MKKSIAVILVLSVLVALFSGCGGKVPSGSETVPAEALSAAPTAEPTPEPEPGRLSEKYAKWLQSGTYYYSLTADTGTFVIDITCAGKDGNYYARMDSQSKPIRQMVLDGIGYAVYEPTGEMNQFDPASEADVIPDFSTLEFKSTEKDGGKVTDTYTYQMLDGTVREHIFVFEKEKLTEMTTPEVLIAGAWPVSDFTAEPPAELFEIPVKTTIAVNEIAEGTYTGTLSGDSYTTTDDEDAYSISPDISPAEITVTYKDGQVELYSAASATAGGVVFGVDAPRSPEYTQTVSGTIPLNQVDAATVRAEGDLTTEGEYLWINWGENKKFTKWDVEKKDLTYHCTVSVTMVNGVPMAEIVVDGSATHRTATVPLALAAQVEQSAAKAASEVQVLWTNENAGKAKNKAKDYYVKFDLPACTVTEIETCHFDGVKPGQLMLYGEDGSEYGPFSATGRAGVDGTKNAYWVAAVNIDLPAGKYAIADSDQSTWSNNDESDGWGMATARGYRKGTALAQTSPFAAQTVENQPIEIALSWSTGTLRYTGAVDGEGLPDGEGTGVMEADAEGNAWTYTGGWKHGHLSGTGELTHATESYVMSGEFKNDQLNGYGTQTQNGVLRYEGEWLEGDLHGQGKLYTRTGELLYEGGFDHSQLAETQEERERRAAPFMEGCDDMNEKLYAKWKGGKQAPGSAVAVWGSTIGVSEQAVTGTVIINMHGKSKYPVALSYRYGTGEAKMTAKSGDVSAWGYYVGSFSYTKDGKQASCPQIEVVYWTAK